MLRIILAQKLASTLLCPSCQSSLVAVGLRFVSKTHYDTLGITKSATQDEIRSAFLSLSKQLHPDINRQDPKNHDKFVKLNEAYMVLSKPIARREYDLNLAARIHLQRQARDAYTSHGYGSSAWQDSTSYQQYEADQQRFWDETIWHMRDQTKDKDFEGRPYYSFTNMRRISNTYIVMGCMVFMGIGALLHYLAIRKSREMHKITLDRKDKIYHSNLAKARENARAHGNALQLQILHSKAKKPPAEGLGLSDQSIGDTSIQAKK